MITMDTEEWRTVVSDGEEWNDYEVSSHGRVRSLNYKRTGKIEILKQIENEDGYLFINLHKNRKHKKCYVHRLIAIAFIPNPQNKPTVNHINEIKTDNRVENLEWATYEEQQRHGTLQQRRIKPISKKVLCVETGQIYESLSEACQILGMKVGNLSYCLSGKYKTCGGFHWEYYTEDTEETTEEESENLCFKLLTLVV